MPEAPAIEAPPSAAPASPAPPITPGGSQSAFDSTFDDLGGSEPKAPAASPEAPTTEPSKTEVPPKDPTTGKFVPKTETKTEPPPPKPEPKVEDEYTPPAVTSGTKLRRFAEEAGSKARKANEEVTRLRSEVEKLKSQPREDGSALAQQLAAANKRIEQYENEARLTRYQTSEEYKTKYEQPYRDAAKRAYNDVAELLVYEPNPDDPENPRERQATSGDFDEIYNLPLGPATKLAKAKFGDQAMIVLQHRAAIKNAAKSALEAVEANKGKATEYEQQMTAQQKMHEEAMSQMFTTVVDDLQTKYPDRFGEHTGDTEWNEARAKYLQMADMAFDREARSKLTPQQNAMLDAQIHMRAAHYAPEHILRLRYEAKVKQLEADIAKLRGSAPGAVTPSGKTPETKAKNWNDRFDEMNPE